MNLESSIKLGDGSSKLDVLSFLEQRPQRRPVVEADVVPGERPVDAVAPSLLLVVHQAGRWTTHLTHCTKAHYCRDHPRKVLP